MREWGHAALDVPLIETVLGAAEKLWGRKKPLWAWGHALPSFGAGRESNPAPPGCDVRVPDH